MSIFSSIGSAIKSTVQKVVTAITPTKAKLQNVIAVEKAAITGKGVTANTGSPAVNKVLSAAASNPFTTAAVVTPVNTIGAVKAGFSALSTGAKVATVGGGLVVGVPAVISNPKIIGSVASSPSSIASFSSNVGAFSADPTVENAKSIFTDNPLISTAAIGTAAFIVGKSATGAITSIANTLAVKENTKVAAAAGKSITANLPTDLKNGSVLPTATTGSEAIPITPSTQIVGKSASRSVSNYSKRGIKRDLRQIQSTRINIINGSRLMSVKRFIY
jgi:hypothetical protein